MSLCGIIRTMDIHAQQINNKRTTIERHELGYRYQLTDSEWCEISLTLERGEEEWTLIELFVSSHNYESNQMTLIGLDKRLPSIIVSKKSSPKSWALAQKNSTTIFYYLQNLLSNYGIAYAFGQKPY